MERTMSLDKINDTSLIGIEGHIKIWDPDSGEVLVRRRNAINFENMSIALASLLANEAGNTGTHHIATLRFGNGGTTIDGLGNVTYKATNTNSASGVLYNQTFSQAVDEAVTSSALNGTEISHTSPNTYSDVITTCTLDYGSVAGQDSTDVATNMNDTYVFDELAIFSGNNDLLTHVVFHPVQKSENRKIQVIYTLRIRSSFADL
ncbi:MAG: hypothetical protein CMQ75_01820 [Gammaproteobacteria bacterium]|nr:hypothetical protein [Gammaproteobacteria bacterium]RPG99531.1 MAG: hypothetical protein CBC78_002020 [Candidatus Pelagibacter sp. TMED118]|tara:strand:- start:4932 stop:5546 length:615 start_codon:yes stop_codon:yes gene_type:complete